MMVTMMVNDGERLLPTSVPGAPRIIPCRYSNGWSNGNPGLRASTPDRGDEKWWPGLRPGGWLR